MDIINKVLEFIISILDSILPTLNLSPKFLIMLDSAITTIISILEKANYFLPLDVMVVCFSVMTIADNFTLFIRIGQWIIRTVRG